MPSFFAGGGNLLQGLMATPAGALFKSLPGIDSVADSALHQMEVLRDHVFTLEGAPAAAKPAATAKPAKKKATLPGEKHARN
jgi:hypothetical protein